MLRGLMRLLVRLFVFALIAGAVGFVITRLLGGEDDDFEDFDDLESSFEFNETPVEIDVSAATTGADAVDTSAKARVTASSGKASTEATKAAKSGPRLIDIKGIGPQYETRLQSIGINTMQDLINADANHVAEQLGVIGGTTEVEDWVVQAHTLLSDN
jgi:predicted flap endonuclease-1-like 5' DNA nuclease